MEPKRILIINSRWGSLDIIYGGEYFDLTGEETVLLQNVLTNPHFAMPAQFIYQNKSALLLAFTLAEIYRWYLRPVRVGYGLFRRWYGA
jgi:hypothetical protein